MKQYPSIPHINDTKQMLSNGFSFYHSLRKSPFFREGRMSTNHCISVMTMDSDDNMIMYLKGELFDK